MKSKLYLESNIPSYLVARTSRSIATAGEQYITHVWWKKRRDDFDVYISQVVLDEISAGDKVMALQRMELVKSIKILALTDEVMTLTKVLLDAGPLPPKAARDAAHIAVAAVHGADYLLTWNCRHIANAQILRKIEKVCNGVGYQCPVLCTPREMMVV